MLSQPAVPSSEYHLKNVAACLTHTQSFFTLPKNESRARSLRRSCQKMHAVMRRYVSRSIVLKPPRSGELRTQKLKSHLMRTQSSNVFPLKPGVGQYMAIHATLTARDFFLAYFYPSGPFTCILFQNLSRFFAVLTVTNTGSCAGSQNKIGHPAGCRFPCWVPAE